MSVTIFLPLPPRVGARAPLDSDPIIVDFTANLLPFGDTIAAILSVTITRADGAAMVSGVDLTRTASALASPTSVIVGLSNGQAGVDYLINLEIQRASGSVITRSVAQLVAAVVG